MRNLKVMNNKYKYHPAKRNKPEWVEFKGKDVGSMENITNKLNLLLHLWKEKCIEVDTLKQRLMAAQKIINTANKTNQSKKNKIKKSKTVVQELCKRLDGMTIEIIRTPQ